MAHDPEEGQGNRQGEAPRPGRAGIEVEDAVPLLLVGVVGVAEDHRRQAGGGGLQVQGVKFVEDVEVDAAHLPPPGSEAVAGPMSPLSVLPRTACTGAIGFQGRQDLRAADIPGVDDEFDALQGR